MHEEDKNTITQNKLKHLKSQVWSLITTSGLETELGAFSKEKARKD